MTEEQTSTIIEHLAELRKRLIVSIIAVVVGMGVAWNFSNDILAFMERPLTGKTYLTEIKKDIYARIKERAPALYAHYKLEQDSSVPEKPRVLNYSAPLEPFFMQCKISMLAGFVLSLPVVFYQLWLFIAPGLTRRERRMVVPFVTSGTVTFCLGAMFFLTIIWPVIINFSLSYEAEGLQSWFNISAYVNFCLRLILIFGLIFELPVMALVLARFGLITYKMLAANRKYALLGSAVVAAFHADLITMFVIMLPIYLMYEISVWMALIFGKKQTDAEPEAKAT